ncbi:MAG TPA: 50S ribosomal protein L9 [Patescibacteria group bacterium]|nr:50S ribosomal protein L9 [Patescibacteria group bacterium]
MKVILLKKVKGLGEKYDTKEVADGYARNFLLPQNLAEISTPERAAVMEERKAKEISDTQKDLERVEALAEKLEILEIIVKAKAQEDGTLYGSVGSKEIAAAIKKHHTSVDEKQVSVKNPIKKLGDHEAVVNLNHGLEAPITVTVERED